MKKVPSVQLKHTFNLGIYKIYILAKITKLFRPRFQSNLGLKNTDPG